MTCMEASDLIGEHWYFQGFVEEPGVERASQARCRLCSRGDVVAILLSCPEPAAALYTMNFPRDHAGPAKAARSDVPHDRDLTRADEGPCLQA